eukprot:767188-Hanusia_phi.AAC.9
MMHRKHLAAVSLALAVCALVVFKVFALDKSCSPHACTTASRTGRKQRMEGNRVSVCCLASETELKADLEAVHALHSRDPNFPVVSPSEVDGHAVKICARGRGRWITAFAGGVCCCAQEMAECVSDEVFFQDLSLGPGDAARLRAPMSLPLPRRIRMRNGG